MLMSDKKMDFMPYATAFLGFMIQYISDINFKISLSSIKIIGNNKAKSFVYRQTTTNEPDQLQEILLLVGISIS
jgi:hypothetical protein